jgi:hypothetical protein
MLAATTMVALLFLLTLGASRASANTITSETFQFTSCHITGGCGTAPYGSVTLTQVGTSVNVVVSLEAGAYFVSTGSGGNPPQVFKFVGLSPTTILASDITITSPTSPALVANFYPSGIDGDGTGLFDFGISCPSCKQGGAGKFAGPIDFTVANATISQLTVANSLGFVFVADVLLPNGNTGPIDASTGVVPDGGVTLMLLGGVLVGLEGLRRKLRI